MQWWFAHSNWFDKQNLSAKRNQKGGSKQWKQDVLFFENLCLKASLLKTDRNSSHLLHSHSRSLYHTSSSWEYSDRWGRRRSWPDILASCYLQKRNQEKHKGLTTKHFKCVRRKNVFEEAPNLDSFFHLKSLHSRWCRRTPRRGGNTGWSSHSSWMWLF